MTISWIFEKQPLNESKHSLNFLAIKATNFLLTRACVQTWNSDLGHFIHHSSKFVCSLFFVLHNQKRIFFFPLKLIARILCTKFIVSLMVSFLVKIIFKLYRSDHEDRLPGYYFGCVDHVHGTKLYFFPTHQGHGGWCSPLQRLVTSNLFPTRVFLFFFFFFFLRA